MSIEIKFNATTAKVFGATPHELSLIRGVCSYKDQSIEYVNRTSSFQRNPMVCLFDNKTNSFPTGLLHAVVNKLKDSNPRLINNIPLLSIRGVLYPDWLYAHQKKAIDSCIEHRRGLIQSPTGSGKSFMIIYLIKGLLPYLTGGCPEVLITVPTKELLNDFHTKLEEVLEQPVGKVGNGSKRFEQVTVGIVNSLVSSKQDYSSVKVLLFDEAHRAGSPMYKTVGARAYNSDIRIGFSGTCWREGDTLELEANIGKVIYNVGQAELHKKEVLLKPKYVVVPIPQNKQAYDSAVNKPCQGFDCIYATENGKPPLPEVYGRDIVENLIRNQAIIKCLNSFLTSPHKGGALVLVKHINHGVILQGLLASSLAMEVPFIQGSSKDRGEVLEGLRSGKFPTAICTSIFNEGTDIKTLELLIIASGGKSSIITTQQAGRVIRSAEDKDRCFIVDFLDLEPYYLHRHSKGREETLAKLYGAPERVAINDIGKIFNANSRP